MAKKKKLCCPECFDDRGLRDDIFPSLDPERGTCSFCGTADTMLVEPGHLAPWFELLVNVYEPNDDGKSLVEWMMEDWQLFTHPKMDVAHAKELLGEILDDGDITRKPFAPSPSYVSEGLATWETLRDEMMYANRWFLDVSFDQNRLRQLLDLLIAPELPTTWYRARIRDDEDFSIEKMGPPPPRRSQHGRAKAPDVGRSIVSTVCPS